MVREYIYDVLLKTKNYFKDHLNALDKVLLRLAEGVFKVNADIRSLDKHKLNILVYG